MNENDSIESPEDEVRLAGKSASMNTVAKAGPVQERSQPQLWLGVCSPDSGHHPGSGWLVNNVCQLPSGPRYTIDASRLEKMIRTVPKFAVVDLFAGPGGLAEGFAAVKTTDGSRPFRIALSIEKDPVAHSTLLLRSFLRQFDDRFPPEYYDFLRSETDEPDWSALYPDEWRKANTEAIHLELGSDGANAVWQRRVDAVRKEYGRNTLLIGGPPCQAYSLVGRARNVGVRGYVAEEDHKHFLYQEYIAILTRLRPAVFVMENVKGMLSSRVNEGSVFDRILADLRSAGGESQYQFIALAPKEARQAEMLPREVRPVDFVVRGEDFGLPQSRHRVIVVGVRRDVYENLPPSFSTQSLLKTWEKPTHIEDVLDSMPKLRSGLSRDDNPDTWAAAYQQAVRTVNKAVGVYGSAQRDDFKTRLRHCLDESEVSSRLPRSASKPTGVGAGRPELLKQRIRQRGPAFSYDDLHGTAELDSK